MDGRREEDWTDCDCVRRLATIHPMLQHPWGPGPVAAASNNFFAGNSSVINEHATLSAPHVHTDNLAVICAQTMQDGRYQTRGSGAWTSSPKGPLAQGTSQQFTVKPRMQPKKTRLAVHCPSAIFMQQEPRRVRPGPLCVPIPAIQQIKKADKKGRRRPRHAA